MEAAMPKATVPTNIALCIGAMGVAEVVEFVVVVFEAVEVVVFGELEVELAAGAGLWRTETLNFIPPEQWPGVPQMK